MRDGRRRDRGEQIANGMGNVGEHIHGRGDGGIDPNKHDVGRSAIGAQSLDTFNLVHAHGFAHPTLAAVAHDGRGNLPRCRHAEPQRFRPFLCKYKARDHSSASRAESGFKHPVNLVPPAQSFRAGDPHARRTIHC